MSFIKFGQIVELPSLFVALARQLYKSNIFNTAFSKSVPSLDTFMCRRPSCQSTNLPYSKRVLPLEFFCPHILFTRCLKLRLTFLFGFITKFTRKFIVRAKIYLSLKICHTSNSWVLWYLECLVWAWRKSGRTKDNFVSTIEWSSNFLKRLCGKLPMILTNDTALDSGTTKCNIIVQYNKLKFSSLLLHLNSSILLELWRH